MSRLNKLYLEKTVPEFMKDGYKNKMAVPRLTKIVVSLGIGKFRENEKLVETAKNNLSAITGQKPVVKKARKAISGFKVRQGDEVGLMVTLRKNKMYDFLDKLINVTLPRLRDFRGIDPKSFDGHGNITIGVKEHLVFPEITHETENIHGLEITIVSDCKNEKDAKKLLTSLGLPFKEENKNKENSNG